MGVGDGSWGVGLGVGWELVVGSWGQTLNCELSVTLQLVKA